MDPIEQITSAHSGKLRRSLSNRHIQLIAIGGAIGTGLFMGSGKTISIAGPSIVLVYLLIGAALFFVMRAMGELLLSDHSYGSFADFAEDLLGPWAGFFTGWTYWICWIITGMAEIIAIVGYIHFWYPDLPSWIPAAITVGALFILNSLTVKAFGETEFWFALIKVVAIIALIIGGSVLIITHYQGASLTHLWNHGGVFPNGFDGFLGGFQIAIFAFVGIELVGTTAAETKDPDKSLPKAINSIPIRIVLFYCLSLIVIMAVTPWDSINPEQSPFVTMFSLIGLTSAATVVNLIVLTSAASSCNSGIYSTSRMMFGLGNRGDSFAFFKKLTAHGVPIRSLTLTCILLLGSIAVMELGGSIIEAFTLVTSVASMLFIAVWSIILVSYVVYRKRFPERHENSKFKVPGGMVSIFAVFGFMVFALFALAGEKDTLIGMVAALVWFAILGFAYAMLNVFSDIPARRRADHKAKVAQQLKLNGLD